jgi:hypothetical protein
MVWIMSWVGKLLLCYEGSRIWSGGGGGKLVSSLFWLVGFLGVG